MPKKNRQLGSDLVVRSHFRAVYSVQSSASAATQTFQKSDLTAAALGERCAAMALNFEFWRLKRIRIYAFTDECGVTYDTSGVTKVGNVNAMFGVAYDPEPGTLTTTPVTLSTFLQYQHASLGNCRHRLVLRIPAGDSIGARPYKWLATTATGTPPTGETSAGSLLQYCVNQVSTGNPFYNWAVIEGEVEFKGQVAPALSRSGPQPANELITTKLEETKAGDAACVDDSDDSIVEVRADADRRPAPKQDLSLLVGPDRVTRTELRQLISSVMSGHASH